MRAGADKATVVSALMQRGMEAAAATELVDLVYPRLIEQAAREQVSGGTILRGFVGGIIGALIGGAIWAAIVVLTDYEVGFMAWGLGLLCGWATVLASGRRKGLPLQIAAGVASVVGLVLARYYVVMYMLSKFIFEKAPNPPADLWLLPLRGIGSATSWSLFFEVSRDTASAFDLLWVVLAVLTAWRIPKSRGIRLPAFPIRPA